MRISDWSSDVCSSDLAAARRFEIARRLDERLTPAGPRWGKLDRVIVTSGGAMSDIPEIHPVPEGFAASAGIRHDDYEGLYAESVRDPDALWAKAAERLRSAEGRVGQGGCRTG